MHDRHHGRRTIWASLAMTQNPAAWSHLQHDFICIPPPAVEDRLPISGESVPG